MSTMAINAKAIPAKLANKKRVSRKPAPLTYFLGFIFTLFIAILIVCYAITRRTTIIYLDEHGKPVSSSSEHSHH